MSVFQPGPTAIENVFAGTGTTPNDSDLYNRRDWLVSIHQEWKGRVQTATHIANGQWSVVWPNLSRTPEAPTVANIVEMGINHWTSIFGAMLPSARVPVPVSENIKGGKRAARKRERRIRELWSAGNMTELAAQLGADYSGVGSAIMGAWVNFEEPNPAKRNPYPMRFDPRHAYPLKDPSGNIVELLVARRLSTGEWKAMYPTFAKQFGSIKDEELEEWFWFTRDSVRLIVADVSRNGRKGTGRYVEIVNQPNDLGFVPVWEIVRPTFDGQRRGIFDQTIHILNTMQRLMLLTVQATEEDVFPPVLEYNTINAEDFGPGATINARSPDARLERIVSPSRFDVKDLIARLGEEARQQSAWPQQLHGEPGASIASSRAIQASMGQIDARLSLAHKQFELLFSKVSGFLLALDETYCDGAKTIYGDSRERKAAEEYLPSRDVAGNYDVTCTYGIGAGSDPASKEMRLAMHLSNEAISLETYREELGFLDDPEVEGLRRLRQDLYKAVVLGVLTQTAQGGDRTQAAEALKLLRREDTTLDEVMDDLLEILAQPAPMPGMMPGGPPGMPGGDGGLSALQGAESLARGGIPGSAEQAPPGASLPPLGELLGSPRQVV